MGLPPDTIVLLGAGASREAGVPTTFEMTERLVERIEARPAPQQLSPALNFVCGALMAHDAAEGQSPFGNLDVERVFSAVELLAQRDTLEVTPFVASWHPAVEAWDRPEPRVPAFWDKDFMRAFEQSRGFRDIGDSIGGLVRTLTGQRGGGRTYRALAEAMVEELRDLVATTPKQIDYLLPLIEEESQADGLTIATLNYDLSIEQAAESAGVDLSTGIEDWIERGRWVWPKGGVRLLKLHGSIDWMWQRESGEGHLPRKTIVVGEEPEWAQAPAVIFGQREKLQAAGPFLGLLAELDAQLAAAQHLLVIGYSFRDDHVNEAIRRWTADDITRTIRVVDPNWKTAPDWSSDPDFASELNMNLGPQAGRQHEESSSQRLEVSLIPCSEALAELQQ